MSGSQCHYTKQFEVSNQNVKISEDILTIQLRQKSSSLSCLQHKALHICVTQRSAICNKNLGTQLSKCLFELVALTICRKGGASLLWPSKHTIPGGCFNSNTHQSMPRSWLDYDSGANCCIKATLWVDISQHLKTDTILVEGPEKV